MDKDLNTKQKGIGINIQIPIEDMEASLKSLLTNPFFLMAFSIFFGQYLGQKSVKNIKLGSSVTLFIGLFLSYILNVLWDIKVEINRDLFLLSLIGFIGSVGLIASKNIRQTIKTYGYKFVILSFFVTGTGALLTFVFFNVFKENSSSILGTYVGALTSSPGLAAALESAKESSYVGIGYAIAYVPGVLVVVLFSQVMKLILPKSSDSYEKEEDSKEGFSMMSFMFVIGLGVGLGTIKIAGFGLNFSLGLTGGVLISALFLGSFKKLGYLSFEFNTKQLNIIRDISLNMFLATVGLNYGQTAFEALKTSGLPLLLMGLTTGLFSLLVGWFIGKYILKIDDIYLIGGVCGGMTSTPGLASAIDAFEEEKVVSGYGATYPFALIFMILWTNLLTMGG